MKILNNIYQWLMCFLRADCQYSLKKIMSLMAFFLMAYLAIWTDRDLYDMIGLILALLSIRAWEKKNVDNNTTNQV